MKKISKVTTGDKQTTNWSAVVTRCSLDLSAAAVVVVLFPIEYYVSSSRAADVQTSSWEVLTSDSGSPVLHGAASGCMMTSQQEAWGKQQKAGRDA